MTTDKPLQSTKEKLKALRAEIKKEGLDGYILPRADEYQNEFVAPYAERLKWLSGFTGSAGAAVVLKKKALAMSDARYMIQIRDQIDQECFESEDYIKKPLGQWLAENAPDEGVIGFDPMLFTSAQIRAFEDKAKPKQITLKPLERNLIDGIWQDRPEPPNGKVEIFSAEIAGRSFSEKRDLVIEKLKEKNLAGYVLSMPDSICWLLNIRGSDTDYIPQALSYLIIDCESETLEWFIDPEKIPQDVRQVLGNDVVLYKPEDMNERLKELSWRGQSKNSSIGLDQNQAPLWFEDQITHNGAKTENIKDPCALIKAQKTQSEQAAIRQAHIRDGAALVKVLHWLETKALQENATELDVAAKLRECRGEDPAFKQLSFPSICGFGANGAIIHYRATQETAEPLQPGNLLLIDSGGQYYGEDFAGTTDITRTLAIGEPTPEMMYHFTLVLKGHINLASARFPDGTTGAALDAFARAPLWNEGLDYAHGTGHGVGCYMAVHEQAANISPRGFEALKPGMLLSNEPGFYKENHYGIRIENLVLVQEDGIYEATEKPLYYFETLSLAPIDLNLINISMLDDQQKSWLNAYHKEVFEKLSPLLSEELRAWLKDKTADI